MSRELYKKEKRRPLKCVVNRNRDMQKGIVLVSCIVYWTYVSALRIPLRADFTQGNVCLCVCMCLSVCLRSCLCLFVYLLSVCLSACLFVSFRLCLFACVPTRRPSVCEGACMSVCVSACVSVRISLSLCLCLLSIYLSASLHLSLIRNSHLSQTLKSVQPYIHTVYIIPVTSTQFSNIIRHL